MKQLERRQLTVYRWWRSDGSEIKPEHVEALQEVADAHIATMRACGFTSGPLQDNIHMTNDDPPDGVEYAGWWGVEMHDETRSAVPEVA